ncbi:hypothetical protein [Parasitella parasitica]|uniref:DM2 domain-containing protein n=1 Tax=Parasitella parasitica TaxID=35722 RepID=A0A0B7NKQ9_9FUNG|nr:hypothetical protein [Parasitella parasitica]
MLEINHIVCNADLHAFHSTSAAPNADYQTSKMAMSDQDNRIMFSMPPNTNANSSMTDTQTASFLDGLDFGFDARLYQQQQSMPSHQQHQQQQQQQQQQQHHSMSIHQHDHQQGLYSPNQFYQLSPQQQHMQQLQQQHYMPVYQQHPPPPPPQQQHPHQHQQLHNSNQNNSQILLQRYNSNGSTTSSTNSQPSYLSNYSPMAHYNIPLQHQNDGNLNKMLYAQHHHQQQQQHLQQLQQPHNLQMNKKRKSTANSADLLEDHLLHQQAGGAIQKKKTKAKKKKTPKIVDPDAPPKPKRKTGLNKPLILSPALSELMDGEKELSRPELVQKLWKYIKDNDLQDPADRRFILCDDKLKKIFDQDRINSFGMNKDLSAHLTKKEESAIKLETESSEQQTDTAAYTETDQDTKNLNTALSATATTSTAATEDVATTAVASNENTNTTPLLLQQEATPSEDAIVTPKEEDFLLNL